MLLFAGCKDHHTMPCNDQRYKYAKVEYNEFAKDGVYIAKDVHAAKGKYTEYAGDIMCIAEGEYGKSLNGLAVFACANKSAGLGLVPFTGNYSQHKPQYK